MFFFEKNNFIQDNDIKNDFRELMDKSLYTYIGLIASILIAISIMMTNVKAFRIINLIGASTFALYGFLIESVPVFALNLFNTCIDIFRNIKIRIN